MVCCLNPSEPKEVNPKPEVKDPLKRYSKLFTDKKLYQEFRYFLQREYAENTIEFYEEIQKYKLIKDKKERVQAANNLFSNYLAESGQREIPIKIAVRLSIKKTIDSGEDSLDETIFDLAIKEIQQEILLDPWSRFQILTKAELEQLVEIGRQNHYKLDDIFVNEVLYQKFKVFLKKEIAEEILLYYEEIQKLKKETDTEKRLKLIQDIYSKFVESSSEYEVNLKSETRELLGKQIKEQISKDNCSDSIFDESFLEIKRISLIEIWSRFQNSEEYLKLFDI